MKSKKDAKKNKVKESEENDDFKLQPRVDEITFTTPLQPTAFINPELWRENNAPSFHGVIDPTPYSAFVKTDDDPYTLKAFTDPSLNSPFVINPELDLTGLLVDNKKWNTNGFFEEDGSVMLKANQFEIPNALTLKDFHGDVELFGITNRNSFLSGISGSVADGLVIGSSLHTNFTDVVNQQNAFISATPKLNDYLGTDVSTSISNGISALATSIAEIGLTSVNTGRLYEMGKIETPTYGMAQSIASLCLESVQTVQNLTSPIYSNFKPNEEIITSGYFVSAGVTALMHSLPSYPMEAKIPQLRIVEDEVVQEEKILGHQKDLDILLYEIDPELIEYRQACWEVFNKKGKDYIGQAASSMRRLVDKLFRRIAPAEEVEKTNYFKTSPKGKDDKGKPSRQARIYYVANYEDEKASHIEKLAKSFLDGWNSLSAWDHEPIDKDGFVYGSLIVIEGHLISLLSKTKQGD